MIGLKNGSEPQTASSKPKWLEKWKRTANETMNRKCASWTDNGTKQEKKALKMDLNCKRHNIIGLNNRKLRSNQILEALEVCWLRLLRLLEPWSCQPLNALSYQRPTPLFTGFCFVNTGYILVRLWICLIYRVPWGKSISDFSWFSLNWYSKKVLNNY